MPRPRAKRVAIYARVSTQNGRQDPETQLRELREFAERRGFKIVGEFVDYATGTTNDRSSYKQLFEAVRKRKVDVVLVWRYDRFARSTRALIDAFKEFESLGVDFISHQENVDTTTPQGELIFSIMASLAQFESSLISERVKAGMARARAQGKHVSRPRIPASTQAKIHQLRLQDPPVSISAISKQLGIAYGTAWNYAKALELA
jgi:DNA invertase Pin-like site-specific DNA recombinase